MNTVHDTFNAFADGTTRVHRIRGAIQIIDRSARVRGGFCGGRQENIGQGRVFDRNFAM